MRASIVAVLLFQSVAAGAQEVAIWCPNSSYSSEHPLSYENLVEPSRAEIGAGDWDAADARLVHAWRNYANDADELRPLTTFLESELSRPSPGPEPWTLQLGGNTLRLPLNRVNAHGEPGPAYAFGCDNFEGQPHAQAIAHFAVAVAAYLRIGLADAQKPAGERVLALAQSHAARITDGLPMWPQEVWLNGRNVDPERAPSNWQTVFLRPSAALALRFAGEERSEADAGFVLEPIGFVRYFGSGYRRWWGASVVASVTGDNGIGYGGLLRYGRFSLGIAHHKRADGALLYVNVDLYQVIMGSDRSGNADEFFERAGEKLTERYKPRLTGSR